MAATATIIDGKAAAAELRAEVAEVAAFRDRHGRAPGLVGIQVGDDPASEIYQAGKARAAEEAGMVSRRVVLAAETTQAELDALIDELNADDAVDGMLVQLPVPDRLSEVAIANRIHPDKDVDGFSRSTSAASSGESRARCRARRRGSCAARPRGRRAGGRRGRGGGAQPDRGQADGPAAHVAQRDRHRGPLAHPRPARAVPAGRRPRRSAGPR